MASFFSAAGATFFLTATISLWVRTALFVLATAGTAAALEASARTTTAATRKRRNMRQGYGARPGQERVLLQARVPRRGAAPRVPPGLSPRGTRTGGGTPSSRRRARRAARRPGPCGYGGHRASSGRRRGSSRGGCRDHRWPGPPTPPTARRTCPRPSLPPLSSLVLAPRSQGGHLPEMEPACIFGCGWPHRGRGRTAAPAPACDCRRNAESDIAGYGTTPVPLGGDPKN